MFNQALYTRGGRRNKGCPRDVEGKRKVWEDSSSFFFFFEGKTINSAGKKNLYNIFAAEMSEMFLSFLL